MANKDWDDPTLEDGDVIPTSQFIDMTSDITTNNDKNSITSTQSANIITNNAKVGISTTQANNITANNAKISYTDSSAVALNTAKVGLGNDLIKAVMINSTNSASNGQVPVYDLTSGGFTWVNLGSGSGDMLISVYDPTNVSADCFDMDNMVEGTNKILSLTERNNIVTNNAKVGISTSQSNAIIANTAKVGITSTQSNNIITNNAKVSYNSTDSTKVGFISVTQSVDLDSMETSLATKVTGSGVAKITVGTTTPSTPSTGDLWVDTN